MEAKGIRMKRRSALDAAFITSDPDHIKHEGSLSEGKTRRSQYGSFTRKNSKTFFVEKFHTTVDDSVPASFIRS